MWVPPGAACTLASSREITRYTKAADLAAAAMERVEAGASSVKSGARFPRKRKKP
jgi:hypothetical protein